MQSLASAEPAAAAAPVDHQALPNQQEHLQPSEKQDFISNKSPSEANTVEQNSQTEIPRIDVTALPHQNRPNLQQMKQSAAFNFNSTLNPSPLPRQQQQILPRKVPSGHTVFNGAISSQHLSMKDASGRELLGRPVEMAPTQGLQTPPMRADLSAPPKAAHGITPAWGYPIKVGFGGSPSSVELEGWNLPATGSIVVTGTIHGVPTVGVSGNALTPQMIASSLHRLVQVAPELIPQIHMQQRSPSDAPPMMALRLKNAMVTRKQEVIQLVKSRINDVVQAPNQDNIVQITNLLLALEAMNLPNERAAEIEKHMDALTTAAQDVFGPDRLQEILNNGPGMGTMAPMVSWRGFGPSGAKKMATPMPKRRKVDEDKHVAVADEISKDGSPTQQDMAIAEPRFDKQTRDAVLNRTSTPIEFISTDLAHELVRLPQQSTVRLNLIERSVMATLGNPTLRKLFYVHPDELEATPSGGESRTVILRLRVDLAVSQSRRIALEVCLPDTADSKTWYCQVIGAYTFKPSSKEQQSQQVLRKTAVQVQEGGFQIESDLALLDQATAGRVDWAAIFSTQFSLNEASLMSDALLSAATALPGLVDERVTSLKSLKELGPMRLLRLVRHNVVVNLTMTEQDRSNGNANLLPNHPIGETKGYIISPSGPSEDGRIEFGHIEKLAAAWSSRADFIRLLGSAIRNQPHRLQSVIPAQGATQDDFSSTNVPPTESNRKSE